MRGAILIVAALVACRSPAGAPGGGRRPIEAKPTEADLAASFKRLSDLGDKLAAVEAFADRKRLYRASLKELETYFDKAGAGDRTKAMISRYARYDAQTDRRRDLYRTAQERLGVARAAAALVATDRLAWDAGQERWTLTEPVRLGDQGLCRKELFWHQPKVARCSGFLVAPDVVATAAHCVGGRVVRPTRNAVASVLAATLVAFDFGMTAADAPRVRCAESETYAPPFRWNKDQVIRPVEILDRVYVENGEDFALVRLERAVSGRAPAALSRVPYEVGDELYGIGAPTGLPLKEAYDGLVIKVGASTFLANLDLFQSNSGSPVSTVSGVVGIAARGGMDFVASSEGGQPCFKSRVYLPTESHGWETITAAAKLLPCLRAHAQGAACRCQADPSRCFR